MVSDDVVRLLIGVIGARLRAQHAGSARRGHAEGRPSALSGVICGAGAAFTSTIASAGMPPFAIHVLPQRMEKMTLVGTITIFFAAVNWMRIGAVFRARASSTCASLKISAALLPLAIASNFLGF